MKPLTNKANPGRIGQLWAMALNLKRSQSLRNILFTLPIIIYTKNK